MAQDREILISWLNDAYAMEQAQIPVLQNHARDAAALPHVRARDEQHLEETRRHAELVESCLERLGESPSKAKGFFGGMMGAMQSVATGPFKDELVKNFLQDYASENLEIASYSALIAAARDLNEPEIAATCERILEDERNMARWLEDNLPTAVRESMRRA
jgi:ferritin-like metal-binding protein YciE